MCSGGMARGATMFLWKRFFSWIRFAHGENGAVSWYRGRKGPCAACAVQILPSWTTPTKKSQEGDIQWDMADAVFVGPSVTWRQLGSPSRINVIVN